MTRTLSAVVLMTVFAWPAAAAPLLDIVYLLDESGSISGPDFNQEKQFATQSAQGFTFGPNDTAPSLITFATDARVIINLTTSRQSFVNALNTATPRGGFSSFTAGLIAAQNQFATFGRPDAHKIIAIVGDGPANRDTETVVPKLDELAAAGVHIFSILVPDGDHNFMQSLVRGQGQSYLLSDFNLLPSFNEDVFIATSINNPGDYNDNGTVDAADYTLWRDYFGDTLIVPNDTTPRLVSAEDYDVWKTNFGNVDSLGAAGNGAVPSAAVPEPTALALLLIGLASCALSPRPLGDGK